MAKVLALQNLEREIDIPVPAWSTASNHCSSAEKAELL